VIADARSLNPEGAIAQLGERLLCKQEVVGSIPSGSTRRVAGFNTLSASKLVREKPKIRALGVQPKARVVSDIVKRRSIRALRVTDKSWAARYLHSGIGSQ
jgi:hypothetical protein